MKRLRVDLAEVADPRLLAWAAHRAGRGKRAQAEVRRFFSGGPQDPPGGGGGFELQIAQLSTAIQNLAVPTAPYRRFRIHDPKPRTIHAPAFSDRVIHHALMALYEPVLERAQCDCSFACRPGKGVHAARAEVQKQLRRHRWLVQVDVSGYFEHIDHATLRGLLARRFKGSALQLASRIIDGYSVATGRGLPIGTLTSQHFANYYLDGFDRLLADDHEVRARVRYMDDVVWWCDSREAADQSLARARAYLGNERGLAIKPGWRVARCEQGVQFCGVQVTRGAVRWSRRRSRRFLEGRVVWEGRWESQLVDDNRLQNAYASVHSAASGTDSLGLRRALLRRRPPVSV